MVEVLAIDLKNRKVFLSNDRIASMINVFDENGFDTDDPDEAYGFLFHDGEGLSWDRVRDFEGRIN